MPVRTTQELVARMRPVESAKANGLFDPAPLLQNGMHNAAMILEFLESHTRPLNTHPEPETERQWNRVRRAVLGYTHFARKAQLWSLVPLCSGKYILYAREALLFYETILNELVELIRLFDPKMYGPLLDAI